MNYSAYDEHGVFIAELAFPSRDDAERTGKLMGAAGVVDGDYDASTHWYDRVSGAVKERTLMDIHVDGYRLLGVPSGATVFVEDKPYVADGSDIELSFDHAGRYPVKVTLPPFLPFEADIDYENSP
jgi:hypothetical protein